MMAAEVMWGKRSSLLVDRAAIRYPHTPVDEVINRGTPYEHSADVFDVQLGADEYWAMGDNRQGSNDSRWWGTLKRRLIHGKIVLCLYSIDLDEFWGAFEWLHIFPFDLIRHPIDFWTRVRWSRCFRLVH